MQMISVSFFPAQYQHFDLDDDLECQVRQRAVKTVLSQRGEQLLQRIFRVVGGRYRNWGMQNKACNQQIVLRLSPLCKFINVLLRVYAVNEQPYPQRRLA